MKSTPSLFTLLNQKESSTVNKNLPYLSIIFLNKDFMCIYKIKYLKYNIIYCPQNPPLKTKDRKTATLLIAIFRTLYDHI